MSTSREPRLTTVYGMDSLVFLINLVKDHHDLYKVSTRNVKSSDQLPVSAKRAWNQVMIKMRQKYGRELQDLLAWRSWRSLRLKYSSHACAKKWNSMLIFLDTVIPRKSNTIVRHSADRVLTAQYSPRDDDRHSLDTTASPRRSVNTMKITADESTLCSSMNDVTMPSDPGENDAVMVDGDDSAYVMRERSADVDIMTSDIEDDMMILEEHIQQRDDEIDFLEEHMEEIDVDMSLESFSSGSSSVISSPPARTLSTIEQIFKELLMEKWTKITAKRLGEEHIVEFKRDVMAIVCKTVMSVLERPQAEIKAKEAEVFEYLEREVIEKERCVTYKEVAANVDYYFIEVAKAVKKFYEENKHRDGLTATFNVCGVKWHETEEEFRERKPTQEEFEEFQEEVDEIRQQMVYSLQFAKSFESIESLLNEDQRLLTKADDIEKWFKRCWWRRGDPEKCRQEMLNSGAIDLHKVAATYAPVLSRGPLPNPNKPIKKQKVEEEKPDKKISALFAKACAREKREEPDKNKHVKKSPMKPVTAAEKEEVLQTSPLFKKMARSRIRIDSDSEDESSGKKGENKTPTPPKAGTGFDMSQDLFSTGSPSPQKMDVDQEPEVVEKKSKTKKKTEKAKKPTAKRDLFQAKEEPKIENAPSTSHQREEEKGPKTITTKKLGHETYMDDDGFLVTTQKTVTVQKDPVEEPQKAPLKRSNAPTPSSGAPPAKKKAPTGQSKISSFFGVPKK
ncbi:hypothetical protein QR680_019326 [Steinernema hermaphroditum]|uniref:DNA polymerase delta subunit 3 n=1 Tax=Steinernema hermaphroditum TaxID=289476 RepID=A0AA39GPW1_9BILA|nr:hypothetical protein QR680_019326 [Steinernema hermaphroditum]